MDRLHIDERGFIVLELKNPFRDATTHILFTPEDFMARLAAGCSLAKTKADCIAISPGAETTPEPHPPMQRSA
jgi:hypothetical protein